MINFTAYGIKSEDLKRREVEGKIKLEEERIKKIEEAKETLKKKEEDGEHIPSVEYNFEDKINEEYAEKPFIEKDEEIASVTFACFFDEQFKSDYDFTYIFDKDKYLSRNLSFTDTISYILLMKIL
jgi:hypothetical protein